MSQPATYIIKVEARFEAAHNLREYYGVPEKVHGHSWRIEARVESQKLDHEDISVDYVKVEKALHALAACFDHNYINEVAPFDKINPTSENVARWFFDQLNRPEIKQEAELSEVVVWEGPEAFVTYSRS